MLCDHYEPIDVLARIPAPEMELDPIQTHLGTLLDDVMFAAVKADLAKRHPRT